MSRLIPLSKGRFAVVDDADYGFISKFKWSVHSAGYACRNAPRSETPGTRKTIFMHREILGLSSDVKLHVDHEDGNKLNNQRDNLRLATPKQNAANKKKQHLEKTTSKYKGVRASRNKWSAMIRINGKPTYLGVFDTEEQAHQAYCEAAKREFGDFANYG
jgi:hypothetical protein